MLLKRLVIVVALLTSAACAPTAQPEAPGTSGASGPTARTGPAVTTLLTVPVEGAVRSIRASGGYVVWAAANATGDAMTSIKLFATDNRSVRTVAAAAPGDQVDFPTYGHGVVSWVEVHGSGPSDMAGISWEIRYVVLPSTTPHVFARSSRAGSVDDVPVPAVAYPYVAWTDDTLSAYPGQPVLRIGNLGDGTVRELVTQGAPATVSIDGAQVVFDANVPNGRDIFTVPIDGGAVRQITHSGRVSYPDASSGYVAWQEPVQGQSDSLWVQASKPMSKPIRLAGMTEANIHAGRSAVIYYNDDKLLLRCTPFADVADTVIASQPWIPARWSIADTEIAWAERPADGNLVIHVAVERC